MIKTHTNFAAKYITWECTTECNYACSYCWPSCHDGKYRWPDSNKTDKLINFIQNFSNGNTVILDIMGGEPTLWPDLQRFCHAVSEYSLITFSSNGSRTARWWSNFSAPINHLVFSFHPENANIDKFSKMLSVVDTRYRTTVFILYHPLYKEKCLEAFDTFKNLNLEISLKMKKIESSSIKYNIEDEKNLLKDYYNCKIKMKTVDTDFFVDGIKVDAREFINLNKNKFKGWKCNLGQNYRYIKANGDIYGASCASAMLLGNIYDNNISEPNAVKCEEEFCNCQSDLVLNSKQCHMQE